MEGNTSLVTALLDRGVDVNVCDEKGITALGYAAGAERLDTMGELLDRGARVTTAEITRSAARGRSNVVEMLLRRGADGSGSPVVAAVLEGHIDVLNVLLDHGADPDIAGTPSAFGGESVRHLRRKDFEVLPLCEAARIGSLDMVRSLLRRGATSSLRDRRGKSPADYATERGDAQMMGLLVGKSADAIEHHTQ